MKKENGKGLVKISRIQDGLLKNPRNENCKWERGSRPLYSEVRGFGDAVWLQMPSWGNTHAHMDRPASQIEEPSELLKTKGS